MSAAYREQLLELFQTMDDEELADYLADMVNDPSGACYEEPYWGDDDDH
ncbi:MAG: hypothetical protein M5R36_14920 [Deltaproteobacteria bacterium]|nr:hypothetical protein [Deltaproteobacteria bacterium]